MPDDDDQPNGINPPHNTIRHEPPEHTRLRLYWYHKRADTLEMYYHMYPQERPPGHDPDKGRGGRGGR